MTPLSAQAYGALFDTAPDAILVVDRSGRIVLANAQAERLFQYGRADLIGQPIETLVPERVREAHVRHRETGWDTGRARLMSNGPTLAARRRDGSEFPVEIALGPIEADGRVLYAASVRDVTDLARTRQAALLGRYNAYVAQFGLQALEHHDFETLIRAAAPLVAEALQADAVIVMRLTPDRRELYCVASFGVSADAAERMRVPNDRSFLPGYLVATREPVAVGDIANERRFGIMEVVHELGLRSALCVPLFDRGVVIGALTARGRAPRHWLDDDTHFMQAIANILATALQRAAAEESLLHAQRLEALGQLTGGVAHDFNNLLMVISGNLQMLEDLTADRPEELSLARQAMGAAERGALLTRKLLAFSRKQPLHPRAVDLNRLIAEFRDLVQRTLGDEVSVRLDLDPALPPLVVDATQLETALLNLALNARDAMPEGGVLRIATGREAAAPPAAEGEQALQTGEYARISITDSGTGMAPEVQARAVEPFFTTKGPGKGSGLGLSMVYGFVRQSGGTMTLASVSGTGTTVNLYLPVPREAQRTEAPASGLALPAGSETVLVVEDDAPVRNIAVAFLERLGYRVLQARDAESALGLLRGEPGIELIFTDIALPETNGIALAEQARALRPSLAVLFTTGYASGRLFEGVPEADRDYLIVKPYRREELAFKIRKALARNAA